MDSTGSPNPPNPGAPSVVTPSLLDYVFPGFSVFAATIKAYSGFDLNLYIPLLLILSGLAFSWNHISGFVWDILWRHLMSTVRIRADDETYTMIMTWVAKQNFSRDSRRFIVNTSFNGRYWWYWDRDSDEEDDTVMSETGVFTHQKKALQYTPSAQGTHYFWYRRHLFIFERHENREQGGFLTASEREEISISCFGRDPVVLKDLLIEARALFMKKDESKTLIYRASNNTGGDPTWQRCMSRETRPLSTVILNEKVKKDLIDDVTDYLHPATRRWYSNRGIPYRRGYLLYGPPGTGKSSLSLALSGFFKMKIYMVSLSSPLANEEHLSSLFAGLPRRCVVLLEDIDTAGLTHTRENKDNNSSDESNPDAAAAAAAAAAARPVKTGSGKPVNGLPGRLSLSGLLNILDGVASQEGRVLIMTTNHLEKLDKALIRPGRVDMIVNFGLADAGMTASIFRAIYTPYEGENVAGAGPPQAAKLSEEEEQEKAKQVAEAAKLRAETLERIGALAERFAAMIPEREFSPAEIQGLLLKHKRSPEGVLDAVDQWMADTRKEKKQKEVETARKLRKEEEKRRKKLLKKKAKKAKGKEAESDAESDAGSGSADAESDSGSDSEAESEAEAEEVVKKPRKRSGDKAKKEKKEKKDKKKSKKDDSKSGPGSDDSGSDAEGESEANKEKPAKVDKAKSDDKTLEVPAEDKKGAKNEAAGQVSAVSSDSGYATPDRAVEL